MSHLPCSQFNFFWILPVVIPACPEIAMTGRRSLYSWHHHRTMGSKGNQPTIDKHDVVTKNMRKTFSQPNVTNYTIEFRTLQVPWLTVSGCRSFFFWIGRDTIEAAIFSQQSPNAKHTRHTKCGGFDEVPGMNSITWQWLGWMEWCDIGAHAAIWRPWHRRRVAALGKWWRPTPLRRGIWMLMWMFVGDQMMPSLLLLFLGMLQSDCSTHWYVAM